MAVKIGKFDRYIDLQSESIDRGDAGGIEKSYSTYASDVPAEVKPMKSLETFQSGREMARRFFQFNIRYRSDLSTTDRIVFDGQNFDVMSFSPFGRRNREFIEIMAEINEH